MIGKPPKTRDEKVKMAQKYDTGKKSKDTRPPTTKVKPTGGLKRPGIKITTKW